MSGEMKSRAGIAQYEATIVLVVISLSLASIVYTSLRRESSLGPAPVFVNEETLIGGSPAIERLQVNSSSSTTISSLGIDEASSSAGVLALDGSAYSTTKSLCAAGVTTFFSVLASQSGTLDVITDGKSWVSGTWGGAVNVSLGWQEVMIQGGTSCKVTLPGGQAVPGQWNPTSPFVSSIPVQGAVTGTSFTFYIPSGGGSPSLLITSSGGFDTVSL
jgi:hypothetical protein